MPANVHSRLFPVWYVNPFSHFQRLAIAADCDSQIQDAGTNCIEEDDLIIVVPSGFFTIDDLPKFSVYLLVLEQTGCPHVSYAAAHAVLDRLPKIDHDLVCFADASIFHFLVGHIHDQCTFADPLCLNKWFVR